MTRVGLFGFGRVRRNIFRILYNREDVRIGAISDLAEPAGIEYLVKFDTILGRFPDLVSIKEDNLYVAGRQIPVLSGKDQPPVPDWKSLGVDVVFEATNIGRTRAEVERHLAAGARRVILMAPPKEAPDITVVMGINDRELSLEHRIVSNASSTVQAVTPIVKILHEAFGIERAIFTTVHAYSSAHRLADVPAEDMRRGRAAPENIIPQESQSPARVEQHAKKVTPVAINEVLRTAAATGRWKSSLAFSEDPIVSSDIARSPHSATFDSLATMVLGEKVSKTLSWFDSSFGYSKRAVELVERFAALEAA